jgi:transcriptional regulator GlxA family with amidase domain
MLRELAPSTSYSSRVLARMLGITPRHLQRIFAATLRRAPQAWLNEQRLIAAKQMLRTAGTVKEVAYSLGFHSASQLSRDFKGYFGIAPSTLIEPQARLLRDAAATVGALVAAEVKRPMGESS